MGSHCGPWIGVIRVQPPAPPARCSLRTYLSFLLPQLLQHIPALPEPQGYKRTPSDQAGAPLDPWGPVGDKEPLSTLPPMLRAAPQGSGDPSKTKPRHGYFWERRDVGGLGNAGVLQDVC